jgi:hypothetical protein
MKRSPRLCVRHKQIKKNYYERAPVLVSVGNDVKIHDFMQQYYYYNYNYYYYNYYYYKQGDVYVTSVLSNSNFDRTRTPTKTLPRSALSICKDSVTRLVTRPENVCVCSQVDVGL